MRRKKLSMKVAAAVLAAATFMSTCPTSALAVTGSQVAADSTYTKTVHVARTAEDDEEENVWNEYDVDVSLTVKDGKFETVEVKQGSGYNKENDTYFKKAVTHSTKGFKTLLEGKDATEDTINSWSTVSGATRTSKAIKEAALAAIQSAKASVNTSGLEQAIATAEGLVESDYTADSWKELQDKLTVAKNVLAAGDDQNDIDTATSELNAAMDNLKGDFKYVYAALNWSEYWQNEGVQAAGSTESNATPDLRGETDKGAFDTVTRATANHGLHRGSFQCTATIHTKEGNAYTVSHWAADGKSFYTTDGTQIQWSRGVLTLADGSTETMENYDVSGIKYVPVKVKASDYAAFCAKYQVVENGGTLQGGYGEGKLQAYTATAEVTEDTNGLKTATKNEDGSFSFSKAAEGSNSGIKDAALKKAENVTVNVRANGDRQAPGTYGEFIRVDLTGDGYGDLGANMQSVEWTYYGNDSTYTNALQTYGTKFAADNWMHKSMGIQLGLTESVRCQLPADTDGTGYWTLTVHALGYEDTTYQIQITDDNIAKVVEPTEEDLTALNDAIAKAEALAEKENDYTTKSWSDLQSELAEAKDEANWKRSQGLVQEATTHLNDAIDKLVERIQLSKITVAGVNYYYYKGDAPSADQEYSLVSQTRKGTTVTLYDADKFQKVGNSDVYYALDEGVTDVKDLDVSRVYAYNISKVTKYSEIYKNLGIAAEADDFDVVTSATNYTSYHAKDISSVISKEMIDNEKETLALTGKLEKETLTEEQIDKYVDDSILAAAGALTEASDVLDQYKLTTGPAATVTPVVTSAEYVTSKYGDGEFTISFDDTVDGYVWNEYLNNLYAATVSDGTTTTGAVHWIDLYGEQSTSGYHYNKVELALNNGTSKGANEATVNRFAAFYDEEGNVKAGNYTITLYSEGYAPVTATVRIGEITPDVKLSGLNQAADGNWYYYVDGEVASDYTGFAKNSVGEWYVENGKITFNTTKVVQDTTGVLGKAGDWYYVAESYVQHVDTVAANEYGWFKITDGKVDFNFNGLAANENGWWKISGGAVDFNYNGLAANEYGWWKVTGGAVDFNYNGLAANEYGWWKVTGGAVDFNYNGLCANEYGWWKITGGAVDFNFNGLCANENGWWKLTGGCIDFSYNGIEKNEYGWWKVTNGKVDFSYNGKVRSGLRRYNVVNGKVDK